MIPALEHHCRTWVVVDRATGKPALETSNRKLVERVNQDRYDVLTAVQWLVRFNREVGTANGR